MKTIEQIQDEVAKESHGLLWEVVDQLHDVTWLWLIVCKRYAIEVAKEKEDIIARIMHAVYARDTDDEIVRSIDVILTESGYLYKSED